jgi:hypothetical protein
MKIPTTRKMFFLIGLVALGMNSCTENTEANSSSEDSEELSANNETSSEKKSSIIIGDLEIAAEDFPKEMGWGEAKQECEKMGDGWRLPTIDELFIIYDNREKIGGFDEYAGYWSSTRYEYSEEEVWTLSFHDGLRYKQVLGVVNKPFRAVRDTK